MHIYNALARAKTQPATYRIRANFRSYTPVNQITKVYASAFNAYPFGLFTPYVTLASNLATSDGDAGLDATVLVPAGYVHLVFTWDVPSLIGAAYMKNIKIEYVAKAEVQDSDVLGAGRRRALYEGTKITSSDINVDSADTIDGGPVITVNVVSSGAPSPNAPGFVGPSATMTQQQQTGEA